MADTKETLRKKRLAYVRTFCGDTETPHVNAQAVLADLRKFVGLDITNQKPGVQYDRNGAVDPYASIYLAAKRDVYLRIVGFLSIDERHLFQGDTNEQAIPPTAER